MKLLPVVLFAIALAAGCRPAEEIRTYRIAKPEGATEQPAAPERPPAERVERTGEPTDRLLGAIVPGPDQAWFFKAVGERSGVDSLAEPIREFLGSVRFDGAKPAWTLPEGWTERPGGGMRLATLVIPAGDDDAPLEMSVIGLGLSDDWDALVLDNVNRWLKQLDQQAVGPDELGKVTSPLPDVAGGAVLVDATGWFESGGMTPPFAGGGVASAAPPRQPPATRPPSGGELRYEKPVNWTDGETSAMRKASLVTPGDAKVTAFAFAAAGQMGDKLGNANRWRGEVGLPPVTNEELSTETEEIELLGEPGSYFEFAGQEETTYAAMAVRGNLVWFFKIRGPNEVVEAQREAFREWLGSLSLD